MTEVLHEAPARIADDLPFAIDLELHVEDRDVISALVNYPDGPARDEYALEALKIGVLALRRASTALDGETIRRETDRLLETLGQQLESHTSLAKERLEGSLKDYFHPESGQFCQRVKGLIDNDGQLSILIRSLIDGEDSRLAKTLTAHVGENSVLLKRLSLDESQGFLSAMRLNLESQLRGQREHFLKEFSLNNSEGALSQLVKELTNKHGDLSAELQKKISGVVEEFSLDKKDSALSRLVSNVDQAQEKITKEFSLDNEQSALRRLKNELTTILEAHVKTNAEFQEEVKVALGKLVTKREAELRSTTHGATFQNAVLEFVDRYCQQRGDVAEDKGNSTGLIAKCKVGDVVVTLGDDCVAAGAKIVVEAKEEARYTRQMALEEIETARKNRGAQHGLFVFSKRSAPSGEALARHGSDVIVVWDAEDTSTDAFLRAGLEICRALSLKEQAAAEQLDVDFVAIDVAVNRVEKCAEQLDEIGKHATQLHTHADKILDRVRIDRKSLDGQIAVLRAAMSHVKQALGKDDPE